MDDGLVYRTLRPGDQVFWLRTDHPDHPKQCREGDGSYFQHRVHADRIAAAWNSYYSAPPPYPWYVVETTLSAALRTPGEALDMFDEMGG